jgi:hypothetical protein
MNEIMGKGTCGPKKKPMFYRPNDLSSWIVPICLVTIIYGILPFGPKVIRYFYAVVGKVCFGWTVFSMAVAGAICGLFYFGRLSKSASVGYLARMTIVIGILLYMVTRTNNPVERLHFIEYGLLGITIERALRHRVRGVGRPFVALLIVFFIGLGDETIQWKLSNRHGEILDAFLNGWGGILGVALLPWPQERISFTSCRLLFSLTMAAIISSTLFTLGTRDFGFMIKDKESRFRFRSRLPRETLLEFDLRNSEKLGNILKEEIALPYDRFLKKYSPANYPFLHEMRVHIFRRDRYAGKDGPKSALPDHKMSEIESKCLKHLGTFYTSAVSEKVITAFSRLQLVMMTAGLLCLTCLVYLRISSMFAKRDRFL